jgi:MFS family permease
MTSTRQISGVQRPPDVRLRQAGLATFAVFLVLGVGAASWAARIPQIRTRLGLDPSQLGLVIGVVAAGSFVVMPVAGAIVHRFGARRTLTAMAVLLALSTATIGIGVTYGVAPVVVGCFLAGVSSGAWDVAMNVHATHVERRTGRSMLPRFHAVFSVGTVLGALIGVAMVALHVAIAVHFVIVAGLIVAVAVPAARRFLDDDVADVASKPERRSGPLARWTERHTLLIGVIVLAFSFSEGTAIDWTGVGLIDGHGTSPVVGTFGLAWFLAAMTACRWFGVHALDRYGRVAVIRVAGTAAIAGLCLFVFSPTTPVAFAGLVLWGVGTALGFPVGISAAADDPDAAAGRVGVVSSVGYWAFLAGPPLIGYLGDRHGVLHALTVTAIPLLVAIGLAGNLRRDR